MIKMCKSFNYKFTIKSVIGLLQTRVSHEADAALRNKQFIDEILLYTWYIIHK